MPLDEFSYRLGVEVTLVVRLFDAGVEASAQALLPSAGPAEVEPGLPELTEVGRPGENGYLRIWRIPTPATGASSEAESLSAVAISDESPVGAYLVGDPSDPNIAMTKVLARKVQLKLNAHRLADECEIELPIAALPFPVDGTLVRSILVEVRRGVVAADDWADAVSGATTDAEGRPYQAPLVSASDDPDFVGFADRHKIRYGSGSTATVVLPCRDFAGVLADARTRGRTIENDFQVDEAIARFLSTLPAAVGLEVVWHGPAEPPILGEAAPKAKKSKSGKTVRRATKPDQTSFLDAIADYCTAAGVIPTFRGYRLELAPARTLDQTQAREVPRMILGLNIEDLELEHNLSRSKTRAVEVRCMNPDTGRVLIARYPPDPNRSGEEPTPGATFDAPPTGPMEIPPGAGGVDEKAPTVMDVYGITDPDRLADIARSIFEEQARQDLEGRIVTKDVATFEGRARGVADLLALRAGDPIAVSIAPEIEDQAGSYVQRLAAMSPQEAVEELVRVGWGTLVAAKVVDRILTNKRPFTYRVRDIEFRHELGAATEIEIGLINYIEVVDSEVRTGSGLATAQAVARNASYAELHDAIDEDIASGTLTPEAGAKLHEDVAAAEARKLHPELVAGSPNVATSSVAATAPPTPEADVEDLSDGIVAP